ncbi:hypothetical protein MUP01_10915 [Candidatus Bathyarchaeota archaeon]|nr:hypothetical protein [Candidatus Bathyarchaeota archaeon]
MQAQNGDKTVRDPERIDRIIEKLRKSWKTNPDWRLCQLVFSAAAITKTMRDKDIFYVEDDVFEAVLNQYLETETQKT